MGPPGHVFGFGSYGRVGCFLVWGTYGGWVATLENPFGTLEALETLGTLCVALCGNKVLTSYMSMSGNHWQGPRKQVLLRFPSPCVGASCLFCCSIVAAICMVRDDMRDAHIVS